MATAASHKTVDGIPVTTITEDRAFGGEYHSTDMTNVSIVTHLLC